MYNLYPVDARRNRDVNIEGVEPEEMGLSEGEMRESLYERYAEVKGEHPEAENYYWEVPEITGLWCFGDNCYFVTKEDKDE